MLKGIAKLGAAAFSLLAATSAFGATITFQRVTNNDPDNAGVGEALFSADVTEVDIDGAGAGTELGVQFLIKNGYDADNSDSGGPIITLVAFDDATPNTLALPITLRETAPYITGNENVNFDSLPTSGGQSTPNFNFEGFETTAGFGAENLQGHGGSVDTGVNQGEAVGIVFRYNGGATFASVINALTTGDLRLALHVQSFPGNLDSEKFISNPPAAVPLPAAAWGGLALLSGLGIGKKLRNRRQHM